MSKLTLTGLPPGWLFASLRDVASAKSGYGFPTRLQGRDSGEIPFAKVSDISRAVKESTRYLVSAANYISEEDATALGVSALHPNTIVFAKIGGAIELNRRVILARSIIVDNNVMGLSPECGIEPLYLYYFMLTQRLGALARATTVPSLRRGDIEGIPFPLPPSLEQKRIAETLDELFSDIDAGVAALERVRSKLKLYRASVLKAAVEGALTADWRTQHPDTAPASELLKRILIERRRRWEEEQVSKFKTAGKEPLKSWKAKYTEPVGAETMNLPLLPRGWGWARADQLCAQITDGEHIQPRYQPTGRPMLSAKNVRDGFVDFSDIDLISERDFANCLKRCGPIENDVLIVSVGATTGRAAIVGRCEPFSLVRSVLLLRPLVLPRFLLFWFQSPGCQAYIARASGSSAQAHLYIGDTKNIAVPLPPLAEQEVIVETVGDQISVIDHLEADLDIKVKRAQALRQSILRQAFTGQLVPQDPNDEPASELLKRIAAEREQRAHEASATKEATTKVKKSSKKPSQVVSKNKRTAA